MNFKLSINFDEPAIPIFNKNNIYYRKEKNDYYSVVLPKERYPQYNLLNSTTNYILSLMDGKNTVYDIYKTLISTYGIEHESSIKQDLSNILAELWSKSIISWKRGAYPTMNNLKIDLKNEYLVTVAFDKDLNRINNFLQSKNKNTFKFKNPIAFSKYDSQLNLRYSLFNMSSIFFMLTDKENNIIGMMIMYISQFPSVAFFDFIDCPKDLLSDFFYGVKKLIKSAVVFDITKIRLYINPNEDSYFELEDIFQNLNFYKVALLKQENKTEDLLMYDCMLKTSEVNV